ncbi:MAG: hypothetical protein ABR543_12895 [Gemmatimonadaceae bacterium]
MALSDLLVLLVILAGTITSAVLLWRQSIRGRSLFAAVWLSFYGLVLTTMMLAHSAEILYRVVAGRFPVSDAASTYNFRLYSLLLLGALLMFAGVECLRAAPRLSRGSVEARWKAVRASIATLAIVAPLIPLQRVFAILLTVLSILSLLVLAWASPTSEPVRPELQANTHAPNNRA